jgi:transposase
MGKHLSEASKGQIIGMMLAGLSERAISEKMGIPKSTVHSVISNHRRNGTVETQPRGGRPRALTARDKRAVKRAVLRDRRIHRASFLEELPIEVSVRTIRNSLYEMEFFSRIAVKKPFISKRHAADRLEFARKYEHWTSSDWAKVIWTDESSFELGKNSRTVRVWRRAYEKYHWDCLAPSFKSGRTSVMVWAAITGTTKSSIVLLPSGERTAADFVRIVYEGVLGDYWQHHPNPDQYVLMEDGAPIHRALLPKRWLDDIGLKKLKWPANSPDLNPIENLWFLCKSRIGVHRRPANQSELFKLIERVWDEIPQQTISNMIKTMPARIKDVIKAKGMQTRW